MNEQSVGLGLTGLANQEEEPHAPGEVDQERHGIAGIPQQVGYGEEGAVELALEPACLDVVPREERVVWRAVGLGCAADEGRCQTPGQPDEQEACYVIDGWGLRGRWCDW